MLEILDGRHIIWMDPLRFVPFKSFSREILNEIILDKGIYCRIRGEKPYENYWFNVY